MLNLPNDSRVLVVSHDAGGAEIVSSWVSHNSEYDFNFVLDGPAVGIFRKKLGNISVLQPDDLTSALIDVADVVFTSTSWGSDIERRAIGLARAGCVYSISFLDHWCNYEVRYETEDGLVLPNEIWVGDEVALEISKKCFPDVAMKLVDNPYFMDIKTEFSKLSKNVSNSNSPFRVLYICEATAEAGQFLPSGEWLEYKSMDLFLDQLKKISKGTDVLVHIRAHPAESDGKYERYIGRRNNIIVEMACDNSLVENCHWADWIIGMNSMALVVAMLGGKKVYYCNIGQEKPKNIPSSGMENLFDAIALRQYL